MRTHLFLWLFLISFRLLNSSINIFGVNGYCLSHQRDSLLHMKNKLIFNPQKSKKLVLWNQRDDCCQWLGVTCSEGRVIALDLNQEFISGGIDDSSYLFSLQYLQSLNLAFNDFHSLIPSKLNKLKNLRYLNLSNAGFEGQIPYEISHLKRLVTLDLSSSFTSQHKLKLVKPNITVFLQNLRDITELYLDGVAISTKGKEWCHALSSLQNLQVLSMSSCNLSGPIDSSLAKLQLLSTLQLNYNNLASQVPAFFVNLSSLTTLQLSGCGLSGVFPKNIFQIPSLQVLDVSDNLALHGSLPNFPRQGSLHYLNLSQTNFSRSLPESIHNLKQLSTLDLSHCQLNGTLPNSMSKLTQLIHLDLSFNNFTGPLPTFNMSKPLTYLSLYHNDLTGTVPSAHFEDLINLVSIDLGGNSFVGRVPSLLFTLPSLQELMLSYNGFNGLLDEFPNASSSLIEILDLSGNNLQGPIPMSIFHLKRLNLLQLSSNKFNGTLKLDMIRSLPNLATLYLGHNNLLIEANSKDDHDVSSYPNLNNLMLASCKLKAFPDFLKNQSTLLFLDLSNNEIEGTIPNWIWRLEFMVYLNLSNNFLTDLQGPFQDISSNLFLVDLHSNQLQGSTPIFSKNIIYLDYSSNRFSSITPPDIGKHLPFTRFLSLSNNYFSGRIHESFCNISTTQVLDLSHNSFDGMIPKCLIAMNSTLRVLNLGGNKLKGLIYDTFSTSCSLRYLDLDGNLLNGTIPQSLANCQKLEVLNLGNNLLTDRFPCFLKSIPTLRVMILRSNDFHGQIGCPNNIGSWETLQIVDLASNNFSSTLSAALLRSWKALMLDEDKARTQFGHLFIDFYDGIKPVDFNAALSTVNYDLKMKLVKLIAMESPFVINLLISDDTNNFGRASYLDSITVVYKGQELRLDKILFAFTSLDFSSNHLEGPILEELMNFKGLHALNLSQNAFSGHIPSSLASLKHLESLDLSINSLSGEIPPEIASMSFLSVMNLSYNHLVGKIPMGTQIQSFGVDSFKGNEGLCGPPLNQNCSGERGQELSPSASEAPDSHTRSSIDWNFLSAELGFTFGFGLVILPLIFWKQWRLWYSKCVDEMLCKIIPQLDFVYEHHGGKTFRTLRWRPY